MMSPPRLRGVDIDAVDTEETPNPEKRRRFSCFASFSRVERLLVVQAFDQTHIVSMTETDVGHLWQRFHGELYAFVRARGASDELANDLLQMAFLRAHQSQTAGVIPEHPRAWLYQIVKRLLVDTKRQVLRQRQLALATVDEPAADAGDEQDVFELVALSLPMFIEQLEPHYRDALTWTEIEGLTQAEAAKRAGISLSGMKSRVQRGRKLVFEALQRCCEFELDGRGRVITCSYRDRGDCC